VLAAPDPVEERQSLLGIAPFERKPRSEIFYECKRQLIRDPVCGWSSCYVFQHKIERTPAVEPKDGSPMERAQDSG
jgi:hypothetical protein